MIIAALFVLQKKISPHLQDPFLIIYIYILVLSSFQGAMFSAIASIEVLCSVVASALFNSVYSATVEWFPGFCFFIMAAVSVVPILLAW